MACKKKGLLIKYFQEKNGYLPIQNPHFITSYECLAGLQHKITPFIRNLATHFLILQFLELTNF